MERKSGIVAVALAFLIAGFAARVLFVGGVTIRYWSDRPGQVAVGVAFVVGVLAIVLLVRRHRLRTKRAQRFEESKREGASQLSIDGEAAWVSGLGARQALSQPGAGIPTPPPPPSQPLPPPT